MENDQFTQPYPALANTPIYLTQLSTLNRSLAVYSISPHPLGGLTE